MTGTGTGIELLSKYQNTQNSSLKLENAAKSDTISKDQVHEVAQEFEALFVKMMLDSMKKNLHKEDRLVDGGQTEDIFGDMLYTEYSRIMSKSGDFGIARAVEKQMNQRAQVPEKPYQ